MLWWNQITKWKCWIFLDRLQIVFINRCTVISISSLGCRICGYFWHAFSWHCCKCCRVNFLDSRARFSQSQKCRSGYTELCPCTRPYKSLGCSDMFVLKAMEKTSHNIYMWLFTHSTRWKRNPCQDNEEEDGVADGDGEGDGDGVIDPCVAVHAMMNMIAPIINNINTHTTLSDWILCPNFLSCLDARVKLSSICSHMSPNIWWLLWTYTVQINTDPFKIFCLLLQIC